MTADGEHGAPGLAPDLTELGRGDIPALLALSDAVAWEFSAGDFETAFASGRVCGHKDGAGRLLSASAVFGYGRGMAWIGIVMVHPSMQRRGLGVEMMRWCHAMRESMDSASDSVTALIATAEGEGLYGQLGYRTVERVHKAFAAGPLEARSLAPGPGRVIEPFGPDDPGDCLDLDEAAAGCARGDFLRARIAQADQRLVLRGAGGEPQGYVLGCARAPYLTIGPLVAPDDDGAAALIAALGAGHQGRLRIDVPQAHNGLIERLPALGFVLDSTPPVMTFDGRPLPGNWAGGRPGYYAISAQAYG